MECSISSPALSLLMKHLVIGHRLKTPNFSFFHWSLRGSLVSIVQHFVATRVVHLPKSTETSLLTESDQSGSNYQLLQLCTARTAWCDSDQAVRAVHSCNSWFLIFHQNKSDIFMPPPRNGERHIVYPCLYIRLSHFLVLFLSPQLLLRFLMLEFEICNTVQTCIGHVLKGNRILIKALF